MKKDFNDIVPPDHRSIRKVSVERDTRRKTLTRHVEKREMPEPPRGRSGSSRWGLWIIALVSLLVLIFGFSFVFSGAKLVVTPKQRTVHIDADFQAVKNPGVNDIGYEIMTIEREESKDVSPTGKEFVEEKASGTIVIYNNYNSSNQRLIKNTRFETPEGLVYRINESIIVPGRRTENNASVPGSIEALVYADEPGEKYNIGLTDFTVPGFRGDPRFESFYAHSKTEMTGGFVGDKQIISAAEEKNAREELQERLKTQLLNEALSQTPEGFDMYENGIFTVFSSLPNGERGNQVAVREKATLYGVLFKKDAIARFIAKNTIAGFDDEPVEILDSRTLAFAILNKENSMPWQDDDFNFHFSGNAHVVWTFDSNQLKEDLAGKAKAALQTVLTGYPSIDEAQIVLRPFWRQTFPEDISDIKVTRVIVE
ncbi:hypothetical protein HYW58_03240 [Candidatus Kaiserbacteria bacterium]|nr:hypothetical protein [Candidatus Kaiserbacteria bacterium]